jgi:Holliday junction resolvasome RuvABC endonuclease subunit
MKKSPTRFLLGVDPGFKNLGAAIVRQDLTGEHPYSLLESKVFNPSKASSLESFTASFLDWVAGSCGGLDLVDSSSIERYVAYQGVSTAETESITTIIGMLRYGLWEASGDTPHLYRAIEWKTCLSKALFKTGFRNPSTDLDKTFSMAAAAALLGLDKSKSTIKTDHEADAICLATIPLLDLRFRAQTTLP